MCSSALLVKYIHVRNVNGAMLLTRLPDPIESDEAVEPGYQLTSFEIGDVCDKLYAMEPNAFNIGLNAHTQGYRTPAASKAYWNSTFGRGKRTYVQKLEQFMIDKGITEAQSDQSFNTFMVYNTDRVTRASGGIHWIAVFVTYTFRPRTCDLGVQVEVFDSLMMGDDHTNRILTDLNFLFQHIGTKYECTVADPITTTHIYQHDTTECGPWSLFYILVRLNRYPADNIQNGDINPRWLLRMRRGDVLFKDACENSSEAKKDRRLLFFTNAIEDTAPQQLPDRPGEDVSEDDAEEEVDSREESRPPPPARRGGRKPDGKNQKQSNWYENVSTDELKRSALENSRRTTSLIDEAQILFTHN